MNDNLDVEPTTEEIAQLCYKCTPLRPQVRMVFMLYFIKSSGTLWVMMLCVLLRDGGEDYLI